LSTFLAGFLAGFMIIIADINNEWMFEKNLLEVFKD